ncbi:hypothetical protein RU639_013807 [Aspergillus parasiticus]
MSWEATIRLLLDHSADPRAVTHQGDTLLEPAAQNGEPFMFSTLSKLLTKCYTVNGPEICHSLYYAVCREDETVFDALLAENFTDMPWGSEGDRLLLQCNRGFFDPLRLEPFNLASNCGEVEQTTVLGKIMLNSATSSGFFSAVEFLLSLIEDEDDKATKPHPAFWAGTNVHGYISVLHLAAMSHPLRDELTTGSEVLDAVLGKVPPKTPFE